MSREIERKFLVVGEGWKVHADLGVLVQQGYVCINPSVQVRVRLIDNKRGYIALKGPRTDSGRDEYEYSIPAEDARALLDNYALHGQVQKQRYTAIWEGDKWDVDVYEGKNSGLVIAELELNSQDQTINLPPWVGQDISHDARYTNTSLARDQ